MFIDDTIQLWGQYFEGLGIKMKLERDSNIMIHKYLLIFDNPEFYHDLAQANEITQLYLNTDGDIFFPVVEPPNGITGNWTVRLKHRLKNDFIRSYGSYYSIGGD